MPITREDDEKTLSQRLAAIQARMRNRGNASAAVPGATLVAASKTQGADAIEELIACGQTVFGENRVQEAAGKWPAIRARHPDIELHLIGPLQTNKAKEALALFDVIQSIDRPGLVDAIVKACAKQPPRCTRFFLQVNTGEEPQKAGVLPDEAEALAAYARQSGLAVEGLMCVPPANEPPAPHFALLHTLAARLGMKKLSMGMSEDFETAIHMGATHVRIGSALFGGRSNVTPPF